ncbi:MAG: Gfo/Idh/MocA family oxidoreductase [Clostridia bacterium]|nr:Gfo/Idh/MocA family oxidoreductase [Clostridia bacterium]
MNKDYLNFGIVGCGTVASIHAEALKSLNNARFISVTDSNLSKAREFAQKQGVWAHDSFEDMLNDPEIDAVCICTPSGFHAENAIRALNAGKHVVLEKPMALNTQDCERIKEACAKNRKLLTVISQLRFSNDVVTVKEAIDSGKLGKIVMCSAYMKYWRSPEYYSDVSWRGTFAFDGGILMNQGVHGVDMLLYLAGNAKVINSKGKRLFHDIEFDDTVISMLEFESGALGVIEASTCAYPGLERRIEIIGTTGSAVLIENMIDKLIIDNNTVITKENLFKCGSANNPASIDYVCHARQIDNFIRAVLYGEKLFIDTEDGAKAVALIEKIYAAAL